jgi:hypothetical protein
MHCRHLLRCVELLKMDSMAPVSIADTRRAEFDSSIADECRRDCLSLSDIV